MALGIGVLNPCVQVPVSEKLRGGVIGGDAATGITDFRGPHWRLSQRSMLGMQMQSGSYILRSARMVFDNATENVAREKKYDAPHRQILHMVFANDPS